MYLRLWQWLSFVTMTLAHSSQRPPIRNVYPLQDATLYSRDRPLKFDSTLEVAFSTPAGPIQLNLVPNLDLLHHGQSTFLLRDANQSPDMSETLDPTHFHVYKGHSMRSEERETRQVGTARIFVHSVTPLLFEGTFNTEADTYHIQPVQTYQRLKHVEDAEHVGSEPGAMVLWADSDVSSRLAKRKDEYSPFEALSDDTCSTDTLDYNPILSGLTSAKEQQSINLANLVRRQLSGDTGNSYLTQDQLAATIGQTNGCPRQRQVAVLGAAADCNFVQMFDTAASARASIIAAFNSASSVYESALNVSLGLGQILISESACPAQANSASAWNIACDSTTTMADRLSLFSAWRGRQPDSYAAWSLLTTCNTESEIGVAWLGTLCSANATNQTNSVVSGANVVAATSSSGNYWRTLAHEIGHNFGANHDCTSTTCGTSNACCPLSKTTCPAGGAYLMNPSASTASSGFSPCSIGQICSNFLTSRITTSCLSTNQNIRLADGASRCGNGIVEEGEDCDCGGPAGCGNNTCCNPTTCRFNAGAVCDNEISTCCTNQCQFAPAGSICRASTGQCDLAETCSGTSGQCPKDGFAKDGVSCGTGLACASGECTSRSLQCLQQMNSTQGPCDQYQCSLTCLLNSNCFIAGTNFISGTPCGLGGRCQAGICDEGSVSQQIDSWFDRNRYWLIPVIAVIGGLILLTTLYCWISSCLQNRKRKKSSVPPQMVYSDQNYVPTQYAQSENIWQPYNSQAYETPTYPDRTYRGY